MRDRPWFLWDMDVDDATFRERLRDPDPRVRAQWQGRVMREASYAEVWGYLSLGEILDNWNNIAPHLGRRRAEWQFLVDGWRKDGLLPT